MLHVGIKLVHQRGDRQARTVALGLIEHQPQVFAHPVDGKTKIELVGHHGLAPVVELPALRCPLANHVEHLVHVKAGTLAEGNRLAQTLHQSGNANLVHHLGQLASATLAQACECFGKSHRHRLRPVKRGLITATHHGQHTVLRPGLATRYRRINEVQAHVFGRAVQLARHAGRGGGVIHKHAARLHTGKGAIDTQGDTTQVIVVAHAAKNEFSLLRRQPRRLGMFYGSSPRVICAPCY